MACTCELDRVIASHLPLKVPFFNALLKYLCLPTCAYTLLLVRAVTYEYIHACMDHLMRYQPRSLNQNLSSTVRMDRSSQNAEYAAKMQQLHDLLAH
jgi:hypothetical protein